MYLIQYVLGNKIIYVYFILYILYYIEYYRDCYWLQLLPQKKYDALTVYFCEEREDCINLAFLDYSVTLFCEHASGWLVSGSFCKSIFGPNSKF